MTPVEVWVRMAELYGERWSRLMGDVPNDMWKAGVESLTEPQLAKGFERLVSEEHPHPPSLPQFMALCRRGLPAYYNSHKRLPGPTDGFSRSRRRANMLLFKAIVGHYPPGNKNATIPKEKFDKVLLPALREVIAIAEKADDGSENFSTVNEIIEKGFATRVQPLL